MLMQREIEKMRMALAPPTSQSDDALLTAFVEQVDVEAFASILHRHAQMVLSVCRRVTRNEADAEDAFQATFLVLATKARSIAPRKMLPGWLYGVAYRAAAKVREATIRRRAREQEMASVSRDVQPSPRDAELLAALDAEIARLPDHLRVPLVLCELEGRTRKEAAQELGWPEGTVASRLARARRALAERLSGANQAGPGGVLALLSTLEEPSVPASLLVSTQQAATAVALGVALPETLPALTIATEVIRSMLYAKLKLTGLATGLAVALLAAITTVVIGVADHRSQGAPVPVEAANQNEAIAKVLLSPRAATPFLFLEFPEIHKDLGLTANQSKAALAALKKARQALEKKLEEEANKPVPNNGQGGPQGGAVVVPMLDFRQLVTEMYGKKSELARSIDKALTPQQVLRLRQLDLQASGPEAFTNRRVVRTLQLTEKQEDDIEDVLTAWLAELDKLGPLVIEDKNGVMGPDMKAQARAQDRAVARCAALLDKRQRRLWEALRGKVFSTEVLLKAAERQKNGFDSYAIATPVAQGKPLRAGKK
jgi:RNA polymerase sigma-70 factor (ECF subfamily)